MAAPQKTPKKDEEQIWRDINNKEYMKYRFSSGYKWPKLTSGDVAGIILALLFGIAVNQILMRL